MPYFYQTQEFERLLRLRDAMWQQTQRDANLSFVLKERLGLDLPEPERSMHAWNMGSMMNSADPQEQQRRQMSAQLIDMPEPLGAMRELDDLIGAARFYGIESPERIPAAELKAMVAERRGRRVDYAQGLERELRDDVWRTTAARMAEVGPQLGGIGGAGAGMLGLTQAAAQQTLRFIGNAVAKLPFFGDAVARSEAMREADRFFSTLQEGITADIPDEQAQNFRSVAGALGMFPAAYASWQLMGAVGLLPRAAAIGSRMPATVRGAIRGIGAEYLITDPTLPLHEQAIYAGLGAAGGAGEALGGLTGRAVAGTGLGAIVGSLASDGDLEATLGTAAGTGLAFALGPQILSKLNRSFPSRTLTRRGGGLPPGQESPIPEAEWDYDWNRGLLPGQTGTPEPIQYWEVLEEASNLTKQATIVESPALAVQSRAAVLDDADVAWAAVESNPGQVAIVQNIGDVAKTVRRILQEQMPNGVGPQDFRIVQRPVHITGAAIISPAGRVHSAMVHQDAWDRMLMDEYGWSTADFERMEELDQSTADVIYPLYGGEAAAEAATGFITNTNQYLSRAEALARRLGKPRQGETELHANDEYIKQVQTDILVSAGRSISNQMVEEYKAFGMFSGQRVQAGGQEAVLEAVGPEFSVVRPLHGSQSQTVPTGSVLPMKSSYIVEDLPEVYDSFLGYAQQRLASQAIEIGAQPFSLFSDEGATQLPTLLNEHLLSLGVDPESYYGAALRTMVNDRYVQSVKSLAPIEEQIVTQSIMAETAAVEGPMELPKLEDLARSRGFEVVRRSNRPLPALRIGDRIETGTFHGEIYERLGIDPWSTQAEDMDGFLLPDGRFVGREEALEYARSTGTLRPGYEVGTDNFGLGSEALYGAIALRSQTAEGVVEEFTDEATARLFLQNYQPEPLDDAPVSGFPIEAIETPIGQRDEGGRQVGEWRNDLAWGDGVESAEANWFAFGGEELLQEMMGGGMRGMPPGPPPPPGFQPYGDGPRRLPPTVEEMQQRGWAAARRNSGYVVEKFAESMDSMITRLFQPMRQLAMQADEQARRLGLDFFRIAPDFERLQDARNRHISEAYSWEKRYFEMLDVIPNRQIRDGTVAEMLNVRPDVMESLMVNAGFKAEHKEAIRGLRALLQEFWEGPVRQAYPDIGYIEGYLPQYRRFEERLPGDPFRHARAEDWGAAHTREELIPRNEQERNMATIGIRYFRTFYKAQLMNEPYEVIRAKLSQPEVPAILQEALLKGAEGLMWGLDVSNDFMVRTTQMLFNIAGKPTGIKITQDEIAGFYRSLLRAGYGSALGGRIDVVMRDLPQVLIGAMHVGFDKTMGTLKRYIGDGEYRAAAWQKATEAGVVVPDHGMAFDPDLFGGMTARPTSTGPAYDPRTLVDRIRWVEDRLQMPEMLEGAPSLQERQNLALEHRKLRQALKREALARAGDRITDDLLAPLGLRHGWVGTWLDWLRVYGAQSEHSRVANFMMGYEAAQEALGKYSVLNSQGLASEAVERQLLKEARVARFQGSIQDEFLRLARVGDYEDAARYFGRHVSDSQNRWGILEAPLFWRQRGPISGRFGMRFLTFSSQRLADMTQILRDPRIDWTDKAAYAGQLSALQGLWWAAEKVTGWNWGWYSIAGAALFPAAAGGGLWGFLNLIQGAQSAIADPEGRSPTSQAMRGLLGATAEEFADPRTAMWNPLAGGYQEVEKFRESWPYGPEAIARSVFTKDGGDPWTDRWQQGHYRSTDPFAPLPGPLAPVQQRPMPFAAPATLPLVDGVLSPPPQVVMPPGPQTPYVPSNQLPPLVPEGADFEDQETDAAYEAWFRDQVASGRWQGMRLGPSGEVLWDGRGAMQ